MKYRLLFSLLLLITSSSIFGQSNPTSFEKKYQYAKQLLAEKKYPQAAEVLSVIIAKNKLDKAVVYASYLYAYATYQNNKKALTTATLEQLLKEYPEWDKIDEAHYLLARTYFDFNKIDEAFLQLTKIKSPSFRQDVQELKEAKLSEFTSDQLQLLYQTTPDDKEIGKVLLAKISKISPLERNDSLFMELVQKYLPQLLEKKEKKFEKKESYNVAVMLPFNVQNIDASFSKRRNVVDLYEGMCLAQEQLKAEGIQLNLFAFDTEKDSTKMATILQDSSLVGMDMLIGPLFAKNVALVKDFSMKNQILAVNPVSHNEAIIKDNPYAFLMNPSYETQGRMLADYALDSLKTADTYVIYGGSRKDSLMARAYTNRFQERGKEIRLLFEFDYSDNAFEDLLEEFDSLEIDTTMNVIICSSEQVVAVNAISVLQYHKIECPVFGMGEWLNFNQLTFDQMEDANIHFLFPNYLDTESENYKLWQKKYFTKMATLPSIYNNVGYETIYTWGKMLQKHGTGVYEKIQSEKKIQGKLFSGYDFSTQNDNQFAPIMKFIEGELVIMNGEQPIQKEEIKETESGIKD